MDEIDKRLLRLLPRDGRMTNVELARQAHLSPPATHERIRRLQQDGVIEGYSARLGAAKLGYGMRAIIRVNLSSHGQQKEDEFARFVATHPQIRSAFSVPSSVSTTDFCFSSFS